MEVNVINLLISAALAFDFEPHSPPRILPSTTLWVVERQPRASSAPWTSRRPRLAQNGWPLGSDTSRHGH